MTPCPDCDRYKTAYDLTLSDLIQRDKELVAAREILGRFYGNCFIDTEIQKIVDKLSKVD